MDENVPVFEVAHVNTRVIHVSSFGNLWRDSLDSCDTTLSEEDPVKLPEEDGDLAAELGCTQDTAAELKLLCSVDALKCNENGEEVDPDTIPEDSGLVTLGIRKKVIERRKETMVVERSCRQETLLHEMNKDYKPFQTMMVLASQKLTELRDAINCVSDLKIGGEFSNNPDLAPENICKDLFKSAFFYFEGVFYNDMRYAECRDISRNIIEWSESRDRGYSNFQTAKMEDYTFNDLHIKIGFPYLYCHQGDCEHIITITDIRLIHHEDCLDRTLYPLQIKRHWFWTRKCFVCKIYIARWVTNNDSLAPDDPCFFCDSCFRMLHYDIEGNKLGEFVAYPYVDPGTFN
ncbi:snRNA-activating protein complex subunit 3 isoform 2-T2 [Rhinophrynus dorsalis]